MRFLVLAALIVATPAVAQSTTDDVDVGGNRVTVGIGPAVVPSYIGSNNSVVIPGVAVQGQLWGHSFGTAGTEFSVDAIRGDGKPGWKLEAGPSINLRLDRTALIRDAQVTALGKLKTAWEPGAWVGIQRTGVVTSPYDSISLSVAYQQDVSGAYGGGYWEPAVSYSTPLSHHDYVSLSADADYVGRKFGRYYYDISAAGSAKSGLAAYDLAGSSAGWKDWEVGVLGEHMLSGDLTHGLGLVGGVNYTRLLGRYAASPIVKDAGSPRQWAYTLGVAYTF